MSARRSPRLHGHRHWLWRAALAFLLCLPALPLMADRISEANDRYDRLVALEVQLLDMRRAAQDTLDAPKSILIMDGNGTVTAMTRNQIRDNTGMVYDLATQLGLDQLIIPLLPEGMRAIARQGVDTGLGRFGAADRMEAALDQNQEQLRDLQRRRLNEIEDLLQEVRDVAAEMIAIRDQLIAERDAEGVINGGICVDAGISADGEALVAAIGYGGGKYPVKGKFICTGSYGFLWDSGASIREFRCSEISLSPSSCSLFSDLAYETGKNPDTGAKVYALEDARTFITFYPY